MASKIHINLSLGLLEVEGEEAFIKDIYQDAKTSGLLTVPPVSPAVTNGSSESDGDQQTKPKRNVVKRTGPGCGARITELKDEKFFTDLREAKDIREALSAKGHNYESKHIAAALTDLTKRGVLRRLKRDGKWLYQNP